MKRWLILVLTTILGFAALFIIDNYYRDQIRQENTQLLSAQLQLTKESLEEGINQRILVIEDLRAFMLATSPMPGWETFDKYAAIVSSHSPEVRAFQYVNPDHRIEYIYPLEGNEAALNLDLMTRPAAPFVEKAIQTRATTINDPTITVQDSLSIVVRSPIYDGDQYLGLVQGVIDITSLLETVSQKLSPHFDLLLKDANGNNFWEAESLAGETLSSNIQVGDNHWELTLGWISPEPGLEPGILSLVWGLGSALLISTLFTINQTFRHVDRLSDAVDKKTAALAESETRYRTLVEAANDMILLMDLDGHLLFYNDAYQTSLGFKEGEEIGLKWFTRIHPDDETLFQEQMTDLLSTGTRSAEYRIRHQDGRWIYCFAQSNLIRDEQGTPQSILMIIRDITERKKVEEAVKFQAHLLNTVEQAVMATDLEGTITYWNKYAEKIYGWSAAEVINRNVLEVTPSKATQEDAANIMAEMKKGRGWSGEFILQRKDGTTFPASITNSPIYNDKGSLAGIVGVSIDITKTKQLEEERLNLEKKFYQAQKMEAVGQLTAGIAHDFNNLLAAINLNTELMQMQLHPNDPAFARTNTILHTGERAKDLIRQLLIFSHKQIGEPELVDLNIAVTEINKMVERVIGESVELELNLAPDLWLIKVDPVQIEQVVVNLMVNARDAMPEGGKLLLETTNIVVDKIYATNHPEIEPGEYVLLTVTDTGVGMNQEVRDRLFEPFFTTKATGKGSGLGLAMVYGFVKQNDGHISVNSKVDEGAVFKVYLPRTTESRDFLRPSSPKKELKRGHETILLVEDETTIRTIVTEVLEKQGYNVLAAEDGQQALQVVAHHAGAIDLLLTDVIMPGMTGVELAEELGQHYPQLKVIYMSGYSDAMISHHGMVDQGVTLLQKPFSFIDMVHTVQEVLR